MTQSNGWGKESRERMTAGQGSVRVLGLTGGVGAGKSTVLDYLERTYHARVLQLDLVARELQQPGASCYAPMIALLGRGIVREDGQLDRARIAKLVFANPELLRRLNDLVHPAVKRRVLDVIREETLRVRAEATSGRIDCPLCAWGTIGETGRPRLARGTAGDAEQSAQGTAWDAGQSAHGTTGDVEQSAHGTTGYADCPQRTWETSVDAGRLVVLEAALLLEDHYEEICEEIWYIRARDDVRRERLKGSRGYSEERITQMMASQRTDAFFRGRCQFVVDNSSGNVQNTFEQIDRGLREHGFL